MGVWASSKCTSSSLRKHITLHLPAEVCQNWIICDRVMMSYPFQDGGYGIAILLPVSVFVISLITKGRNLNAYQISAGYLNPRLRYNYLRFLKTNVRHFGILLPFQNLRLRYHRHAILYLSTKFRPNRTIRDGVMTSYPFFKMAARASQFYFRFRFS